MKELALRAIEILSLDYDPAFVILYGSVVRGDFNDESDIDLACFCESPNVSKDVRLFEGKQLDCWLYQESDIDPNRNAFLRFAGGEVFRDKNGIGEKFLDDINNRFNAGPEPVTPDAREHLVVWSQKMLRRAGDGDIEANFRRTELPCQLLEIYFKLRNLWFMGSKQSFHWLESHDIQAYRLFEQSFSEPTNLDVLTGLASKVVNTEENTSIHENKLNQKNTPDP